jgi:hypothetical protein
VLLLMMYLLVAALLLLQVPEMGQKAQWLATVCFAH